MKNPLGDVLLEIGLIIFCVGFVCSWLIFLVIVFLKWLFPKFDNRLEVFLDSIIKPLGLIQKYSLVLSLFLFLIRLIAGWLGWAEPLMGLTDE